MIDAVGILLVGLSALYWTPKLSKKIMRGIRRRVEEIETALPHITKDKK